MLKVVSVVYKLVKTKTGFEETYTILGGMIRCDSACLLPMLIPSEDARAR